MVQPMIAFALGLYLLGESIAAAALMHGGDKFFRVAKYLFAGVVGIHMMAEPKHIDIWHIAMALALALFLLPKALKRLQPYIDHFMEDWHA